MARAEGSLDGINGHVPVTFKLDDIVWDHTWRKMRSLLVQETLRINEYIFGFQPRYIERNSQVLSCTSTLQPHLVMRMMMMRRRRIALRCNVRKC